MARLVARLAWSALAVSAVAIAACHSMVPPSSADQKCERTCRARASSVCSADECAKGCSLALDRVIEHETDTVIACVARSTRSCSITVWAECGVRVGPRLDGGPPAPVDETFPDED